MKILHISAECYPAAKVGGLADVVGALPKYQNILKNEAQVIMPYYNLEFNKKKKIVTIFNSKLLLGQEEVEYQILKYKNLKLGFDLFLVHIPQLLYKEFVYSEEDTKRFIAFQIAALDWILTWNSLPNVIHCHDHHTGLIPFMTSKSYKYKELKHIPTVVTIHNAQYQGWFSHYNVNLIPNFNFEDVGLLDWNGVINPLATAIKCAWKVNTVSPNYMNELKNNAKGLENLLEYEKGKCVGILNGIDTEVWNTEKDNFLIKKFKPTSVQSGRKANKKWLCKKYGFEEDRPLFAFIGRLVHEKGADLLPETFRRALVSNKNISILVLGSGNIYLEHLFNELKEEFKGRFNVVVGYNEKLSHIMYAGSDFLILPSRVEPCGLNQLYALRYGSIPMVTIVGGLKDTVTDISLKNGNGITLNKTSIQDINNAITRAIALYQNQPLFRKIRNKNLKLDYSWNKSAEKYIELYKNLKP